jgi:hypothetical protein
MDIFVFPSADLTNIWAGVGAKMWAVSLNRARNKGTITKSKKMQIGSIGIIYCSETKEFTTPFLVTSDADPEIVVSNIWPQEWGLSFGILPLGSPKKRIHKDKLRTELPSATGTGARKLFEILPVRTDFSFQASKITAEDWAYLFHNLAD